VRLIRTLCTRLCLAALLLGAGCAGVGEKEAQLEFERLRRGPSLPQGDSVLPIFGTDPAADESLRFTWRAADRVRQP